MPEYRSGIEVLADARLRAGGLGRNRGVIVLEGGDDRRLVGPHCVSLAQIVVAGNKPKLLVAYRSRQASDEGRIVFVTDCDYDVAAGHLGHDRTDLVITQHADMEADLVGIGLLRNVVGELVPDSLESDDRMTRTTQHVLDEAVALASVLGRLRQASHIHSLGLNFRGIEVRRFRKRGGRVSSEAETLSKILQRSPGAAVDLPTLSELISDIPDSLAVCQGHDLIDAIACVLHQEYRVPLRRVEAVGPILRSALDGQSFRTSPVGTRLSAWEERHSRVILRP